jgi:hypothetical protein
MSLEICRDACYFGGYGDRWCFLRTIRKNRYKSDRVQVGIPYRQRLWARLVIMFWHGLGKGVLERTPELFAKCIAV